jgi:hypothetical protein
LRASLSVAGKLPATAGWQRALPRMTPSPTRRQTTEKKFFHQVRRHEMSAGKSLVFDVVTGGF